jgi:sugar phosphate isomerase/epimerase
VWAVPDAPVFTARIARAVELAERGAGEMTVLTAAGRDEPDAARLEALFTAERDEEWAEFLADCAKFDAEIDKEIRIAKFTMAELEEEEHSLERLRRWHRELAARDVFGAPAAAEAGQQLKHCAERLADYTERVFAALHQM